MSAAAADEYSIAMGTPHTGTSIPPGRVGLGIPVPIGKGWADLSVPEQQAWRAFTDLLEPEVTPPFPAPNIRALLRKLDFLQGYDSDPSRERRDEIFLIVRVTETGDVNTVDIMRGADQKATELTDPEKVLAYRYINALTTTKFSPALLNGKPVASAFPMQICSVRVIR